jgi:23S rRNA-/tRNA-specific pseudouridylate synthase
LGDSVSVDPTFSTVFFVEKPIYQPKSSYVTTVAPDAKTKSKSAVTKFEFLFYCSKSNTSVLKCFPLTGRTHQIRVHLQSIGHPIANDSKYGGEVFNDMSEEVKNSDLCNGKEKCMKFWLHAYSYEFKDKIYRTTIPKWAEEEYTIDKTFGE